MFEFSVGEGAKRVEAGFKKLKQETREQILKRGLETWCVRAIKNIKERRFIRSGGAAPVPGVLTSRSGGAGLMGSYHYKLEGAGKDMLARLGSPVIYARIHELGGIIKPKTAPFLAFRLHDGTFRRTLSVTMPKRPVLDPAVKMAKPYVDHDFNIAVMRAIRRANLQ